MKQYNLHFLSKVACSIFINGNNVGVIDNDKTFFIDIISYNDSLIVAADPLNQNTNYISNCFRLSKLDNNLFASSKFVTVVPYPESNYDIILDFAKENNSSPLLNVYNQNLNGYNVMVTNSNNSIISIFKGTENLFSTKTELLSNISCEYKNGLLNFNANTQENEFLLVFDTTNNTSLICDSFLKVEKFETEIKTLKPLNDFFKHGIVKTLNRETKQFSNYTVFINNTNFNITNTLIPYAFLECVKACDYSKAKSYLDNSLGNITNSKLETYFNEIKNIYYNYYFFEPNQTNCTIETSTGYKNYTFTLLKDKICEIEENAI